MSSTVDVLREVSDQHLTCSICMDLYTDPKQLPCLHNFCKKCLTTHILKTVGGSGGASFLCPVCRKVCKPVDPDPRKLLQWVDSFPDNFNIRSMIDTFEVQQREAIPVPVEDQLRSLSVEAETCPKHRKETVASYCVVKKLGVCGICLKSSAHDDCVKTHLTPEAAKKFAGERIQNFKRRIETLSSRVETTEVKLAARPDELKFKKEELAIEISHYFSELRTLINKVLLKKEKEALGELKQVIKNENGKISGAKDETKSLSGSLTSTEQLFNKLMENRPVGALSVADSVENQIAAYERATSKVESGCKKLDITLRTHKDIGENIENMSWGNILVGGESEGAGEGHIDGAMRTDPKPVHIPSSTVQELSYQLPNRLEGAMNDEHFTGPDAMSLTPNETSSERIPLVQRMPTVQPSLQLQLQPSQCEAPSQTESSQRQSSPRTDDQAVCEHTPPKQRSPVRSVPTTPVQAASSMPVIPSADSSHSGNMATSLQAVSGKGTSSLSLSEKQSVPSYADRGFRFSLVQDFNGLCPNDTHSASYVGVCPFGQNCLIIVDRWNKKLKLIQVGGRILLFLEFADQMEPWDVTPVSQDKVAVTCPGYSHILMIAISTASMDVCRYIKTSTGYSSLVHLDGNRFAAGVCKPFGSPHVDILDTSSSQTAILMQLPSSVTYPRTLDLTKDRHLLICDWSQKEVSVFDAKDFRQLLRYKGAGREAVLREPVGATKDRRGNLYILDRKTKKVHVVASATGAMLAILPLDVPSDPKVVVIVEAERRYSTSGEVLVVALGNGKLFVYDLVVP